MLVFFFSFSFSFGMDAFLHLELQLGLLVVAIYWPWSPRLIQAYLQASLFRSAWVQGGEAGRATVELKNGRKKSMLGIPNVFATA
jgi:hypothetical protein